MITLTDKVDELFAQWNTSASPGCAVAVIQNGEVIYKRGYGMADLERNVPLSPASAFDLGSTGKQFTAMLIAILAKQGSLSLDDSVHKYIPELPTYEQPITIRHLLHHTSGLPELGILMYLSGMPFENFYYEDEMLDLICRHQGLNCKPGDEFFYINTGYVLLGIIAKRIAGKPYPELIRETILEPLGMHATDFNDDAKRIVTNRAIGYSPNAKGGYCTEMSLFGGYGDGAILSTVEDLFRWDQNFYHNILGGAGQELIQEILAPGKLNSGERLGYAFGLFVRNYRGLRIVRHPGAWTGYQAELIRFPDQKFSVICLANLNSIRPWRLAQQVADLYLADQFTEPGQLSSQSAIDLPRSQIERITGFYRNQRTREILKLSIEGGKFAGELFGRSFELIATSSTHLQAVASFFDLQLDFEAPHPENALLVSVAFEGRQPDLYRKLATTPIAPYQLADYLGDYRSDELNLWYKVLVDGGQLFIKRGYASAEALQSITKDFFISHFMDIQFERNEQSRVCAFRLGADRLRDIRFIKQNERAQHGMQPTPLSRRG